MSKLDRLIEELCPDGVEYVKLEEICTFKKGDVFLRGHLKQKRKLE